MELLSLPTELLSRILEDVGPAFFTQDIGRLLISRRWYAIARRGLFHDVTLRAENVHKLLCLHDSEPEKVASMLAEIQTLRLEYEGLGVSVGPMDRVQELDILNDDLVELSDLLIAQAFSLTSLNICAAMWSVPTDNYDGRIITSYMNESTLYALLQVVAELRLDELVLDVGTLLIQDNETFHICPAVGSLLPVLRKLHVHMAMFCPAVLVSSDADAIADADEDADKDKYKTNGQPTKLPRLEEVVVHTTTKTRRLSRHGQERFGLHPSLICNSNSVSLRHLQVSFIEQLNLLAAQMATPKKMRILMHTPPAFELASLDLLADTEMLLTDDQGWDEDGEEEKNGWWRRVIADRY